MTANDSQLAIHDQVVVEGEIAGRLASLEALVTNVLPEALWLALRAPDERLKSLATGQCLHLTFDRAGGPVVAESAFIRRLGGDRLGTEKSRVFAVARPAGVESAQRRAHVRIDLERPLRLRLPALVPGGVARTGNGRTLNISAGGLKFTADLPLLVGDVPMIALGLASRNIVTAAAQVVRIDGAPDGGARGDTPDSGGPGDGLGSGTSSEPPPGEPTPGGASAAELLAGPVSYAVRFTRISEADQERIVCYILSARRGARRAVSQESAAAPDAAPEAATDRRFAMG